MKHITRIVVVVLVATGVIILLYSSTSTSASGPVIADEPSNTPLDTLTVISNEDFSGTTNMHRFNIPSGFGYVKVSFKNTGSKHFTFTINEGSPSGTGILYGRVPADGKEHTYYSGKALSTGWYYVNTSSGQGMSGILDVSLGTDANK